MQNIIRLLTVMFAFIAMIGCNKDQAIPSNHQFFVGTYVYVSQDTSEDRATDHELDSLTLKANGTYVLLQGGSTKPKSIKNGAWYFIGGNRPNIELDHAGYPIQIKRGEVRLLINDDLGEWYAKSK